MGDKIKCTTDEPSKIPYKLLKHITNDFNENRILGSGAFGTVYKGLDESGGEVAVKILHNMLGGLDDKEFQKEFDNLKDLKHQNIVELVGFCSEFEEELVEFEGKQITALRIRKALCFEFVHYGSLQKRISDECSGLKWHTRYRIIKGVCQGLKYLREGLNSPVMHFDLKPDNILLDKNMVPKIADFGLSRLFGEQNTTKTMSSVGTCGYWPPEYIKHQVISQEFDIFSLGVIIVKIMIGHEGYQSIADMTTRKFINHVYVNWRTKLGETMSAGLLEVYCNQVKICIEIALDCLKPNRQERPTIQYIVSSLNKTETIIGDSGLQIKQHHPDDVESFPASRRSITTRSSSGLAEASRPNYTENHRAVKPFAMSFNLLRDMTNDFSEERLIRQDLFGKVYKGVYKDGEIISVRVLHSSIEHGHKQFLLEITNLMKIHHQNVIQLVGYCSETTSSVTLQNNGEYLISDKTCRAMCFQYLPNGSLDQYISDPRTGLDWCKRYQIIKSACNGLRYLHEGLQGPIIHMNLKPSNILLDENMVSKLDNPGVRLFSDENSMILTGTIVGMMEYIPPEFIHKQVISTQYDIYSLGVVIIEIVTGKRYHMGRVYLTSPEYVELVHKYWTERLEETEKDTLVKRYCQQVKKCLEIAFSCVDHDRLNRPSIRNVIHMLNETESLVHSEVFDFHPLELSFPFMSSSEVPRRKAAIISCPLQLSNRGDDRVAFMLVANTPKWYLTKKPLCGIVPPMCDYTLTLTMPKQPPLTSSDIGDFFTLYSVAVGQHDLLNVDKDHVAIEYDNFFKKIKETASGGVDEVQQVKLNVIWDRPAADQGTSSSKPYRSIVEILTTPDAREISSMDVHPTEPWIMTTHHVGSLRFWNYKTMATLNSFQVTDEPVHAAKFIAREKWVAAGDSNGCIHVYSYGEQEDVERFDAHDSCITTLVVHPTHPFLLSSSSDDDHLIKLWNWDMGWECTQTFQGHSDKVTQVTFNPEDKDSFASTSLDGTVKIWNICSGGHVITLKLAGESLLSADYFTRLNRQHLIVGCKDRTAQICDLGIMEGCVYELEGHADRITTVTMHPELPMLITASLDGTVRIWNPATYKLERIISFNLGAVYALGCIEGTRRILAGCHQGIATMELSFS